MKIEMDVCRIEPQLRFIIKRFYVCMSLGVLMYVFTFYLYMKIDGKNSDARFF